MCLMIIIYLYLFLNFRVLCCPNSAEIDHLKWEFKKLDKTWVEQLTNDSNNISLNGLIKFNQQELQPISEDILTRLNQSKLRDQYLANINPQLIWGGFSSFIRCISALSGKYPKLEKLYLAQQTLQRSVAMDRSMETIFRQLQSNLLRIIDKDLNNTHQWCISETTQLDYAWTKMDAEILVIYEFVAVTELRNEIIERIRKLLEGPALGSYQNMRVPHKTRALFDKYLSFKVHKDIRRCDPNKFTLGKNYLRFTKLLQGFIRSSFHVQKASDYNNRCSARTFNCLPTTSTLKACQSPFKHKRFDFIQQSNGTFLGRQQYCSKIEYFRNSAICLCDQTGADSDRYISLIPVTSNILQNKVITGVKFTKPYRILQLQIQQGQLLRNGNINQSTVEWIPAETFNVTDAGVLNKKDFFLLTNLSRTIAIDELETNKSNHAMTGIGFTVFKDVIHLKIRLHSFNADNGLLNSDQEVLKNYQPNRPFIHLSDMDVPSYTDRPSELMSFRPMFLNFTHTGFQQDMAQTTVPFLDSQEVTSNPAVPLTGAGLYYKARSGYGGFLAPVIKTMRKFMYVN